MKILSRAWQITNRCFKWWGIFLVFLLFISAIALMTGVLTLDVDLDLVIVDDVTNPMFALIFFALILLLVFYPVLFVVVLPIAYLISFKTKEAD
ncbi:MAG: hypothetical protein GKR91_09000 [Pseudomonadales bacterium]|nr:hypothetical protein [Pseudomonadales bacterium]